MRTISVILDNIRSVHNVGSIFRTCDGAGVSNIYLCGVTPSPIDRFGRARRDFAKVSLGAQNSVAWKHVPSTQDAIVALKKDGVRIVAVEQDTRAKDFKTFSYTAPTAFVFGEETKGISKEVLDMCDDIVEIPMVGKKESLNVSVTAGIILFSLK
ncbi:MAG: RNA methyltransferase [Candidatus Campbellbacteria bacterium]